MFWFAQFVGLMASSLDIFRYFIKDKKALLILKLGTQFFIGTTFLLLNAFTGAIIYMIIGIMIMNQYIYEIKEKELSKKIFIIYFIVYVLAGIFSFKKFIDMLPLLIALIYIALIVNREKRRICRFLELSNSIILTIYALCSGGYALIISSITLIVLYAMEIYKYDVKKEIEPESELEMNFTKEAENRNQVNADENSKESSNEGDIVLTSRILTGTKTTSNKARNIYGKNGGYNINTNKKYKTISKRRKMK